MQSHAHGQESSASELQSAQRDAAAVRERLAKAQADADALRETLAKTKVGVHGCA